MKTTSCCLFSFKVMELEAVPSAGAACRATRAGCYTLEVMVMVMFCEAFTKKNYHFVAAMCVMCNVCDGRASTVVVDGLPAPGCQEGGRAYERATCRIPSRAREVFARDLLSSFSAQACLGRRGCVLFTEAVIFLFLYIFLPVPAACSIAILAIAGDLIR